MKRISVKEAQQYISCKNDFTSDGIENAQYFTLSPSKKEGWEDVTYYTARKSTLYSNRDGDYDSWVYVLSNALQPGIYKIGYTNKHPEERAKQISNATGVALPYDVEFAFHCYNGLMLEGEIHKKLNGYRVNNQREFFQLSLEEIKTSIEELGERYI
jgi:hypothetical protein